MQTNLTCMQLCIRQWYGYHVCDLLLSLGNFAFHIVFLKPFKFYLTLIFYFFSIFKPQFPTNCIVVFIGIKNCMQVRQSEFRIHLNNVTFCIDRYFQYKLLLRRFRSFQKKFPLWWHGRKPLPLLTDMVCIHRIGEDGGEGRHGATKTPDLFSEKRMISPQW